MSIIQNCSMGSLIRLQYHSRPVSSLAFSPNGEYLASGSLDETIILFRVPSGELIKVFTGHSFCVNSVAFSCCGEYLASASNDCTIIIWRVSSGECIRTLTGNKSKVKSLAFLPNEEYLASGSWDRKSAYGGYRADNPSKLWQVILMQLKALHSRRTDSI